MTSQTSAGAIGIPKGARAVSEITAYWQPGGTVVIFINKSLPAGIRLEIETGRRAPINYTVALPTPRIEEREA